MKQYIMHVLGSVSQELYFPDAHLTDIIEILILTYLIYHIAMWLINTKAWMLMRGIVVLGIFVLLAAVFKMHTILFLARNSVTVLATAAVVVFQPELRSCGSCSISAGTSKGSGKAWGEAVPEFNRTI